ncbi:MAG: stage II sporulation protein M [Caldimonas sp.]
MTPLRFEEEHEAVWSELEASLGAAGRKKGRRPWGPAREPATLARDRFARLYRATCEHLAIAQARSYPVGLIDRLEALTARAHQRIYRQTDFGLGRLARLFLIDFPAAVRAHRLHVLIALVVFAGPLLAVGVATYLDPGFILTVHDVAAVEQYDRMYGDGAGPIGRRDAGSDWAMFGHYIRNNIGIAFQCFASGIFFGAGSIFFLAVNGLMAGGVAGYLTWRGHGENFYSFVITHGAFELPALVLAGAAGLALGQALLAPGRQTRVAALKEAAERASVLVYGVTAMLLVAAALEAFWSSARWVDPVVKYAVGAACWAGVVGYFLFQGRPRRPAGPP